MQREKKRTALISQIVLTILAFIWIIPILYVILQSFRSEGGQFVSYFIPHKWTLNNYIYLFTNNQGWNYGQWFTNTLFVSVISGAISTFITIGVAYALSRLKFRLKGFYLRFALIIGMFPGFLSMISIYYILKALDLTNSLWSLIIMYSYGAALGFYVQKGFFDTIPQSLDERAQIDGASRWDIFRRITLPLAKPIIVYTALLAFTGPWMDFIFAQVVLGNNQSKWTVAVGLFNMVSARENANSLFMSFAAGSVLIAIPITLLFIWLQRFFVEGVTAGSVKG
ncbi:sugar ABC transporter permease [Oenococcus kitaharae]|uniref:Maltose/maltodextrin ABC permease n=1 Tax=Oenococcus kitaharae DSM 17330 TaxID=1045004 RepID=G9WFA6_9LACO|nr:sugar ABC transporter permease [Oenococcus kitaharae]EHN58826.1 Maltose/maltodextrin ABC permease [Oenococcus kitaharae DSM 17330]OEY81838.1 sugar ABC transporter permease [Oenococcus kitaharae]OEY84068.1 sugar ABC transporter permease [Oenococcus kitaharae]OEY85573.1 sugar ABC transporter permease [Oenococcus kitaharae]